jgi:N-acetylglucosaminyldiphosphoundecaprenol N-acetyl-beta-D-mannosaminyltransferase
MNVMRKSEWIDGYEAVPPPARVSPLQRAGRTTSRIAFLGLVFDALKIDEAAQQVMDQAHRAAPFVYVTTPNVDHRVRLQREPRLAALYELAWMTLCDSRVIELIARLDGLALRAVPGADLVEHLFETRVAPRMPINIIGSSPAAIELISSRYGLGNVHWHQPPTDLRNRPDAIAAAAAFVAQNPAALTFICVGSPQQELVARAIAKRGDAIGVGLCCGASLEFLSGVVARAPRWMRALALEWLHRLATNPIRFSRRYLIDGPAIFPIWLAARGQGAARPSRETSPALRAGDAAGLHATAEDLQVAS